MAIRLTLRTLLSYLDDTLEPAQAKVIGAKVAESEQARELMERIKQVTRRRRLMTPAMSGPGGIDPNTIAEYLDNEVTPEQASEVEQICLASDVHLAEVAACHQILTLVLGEPALVPPSAKQRMYGLVKGPEAIPFRKPAGGAKPENDLSSEIEPDQDETLRMGVPAASSSSRNTWMLIGGGIVVVCALAFAVWQLIHTGPATNVPTKGGDQFAKADAGKDKAAPAKDGAAPKASEKKEKEPPETITPMPKEKQPEGKSSEFVQPKVISVDVPKPAVIKYAKASDKQEPVGKHVALNPKDLGVLLQATKADKPSWARVPNMADVVSGRPLLALPANKSVVILGTGVELTLWGNLFELTFDPILLESRAIVHANDLLDADVTLQRGRLVLRNKADKEAHARVRFEDPTLNQEEHLEITLYGPESAVIVERFGQMDRDEPFYEKMDDPMRKGPTAVVSVYAYGKSVRVSAADASFLMDEDQRPTLQWQSRRGVLGPPERPFTPPWLKGPPKLKEADAKSARTNYVQAATEIAKALEKRPINTVLAETLDDVQKAAQLEMTMKKQVTPQTQARWRYAVQCMRGIDDIAGLFDIFTQPATPPFIRYEAMTRLQQWIALSRDNDYQLFDVVRKNYRKTESVKIMELFHLISEADARKPAVYETLIEGLNNDLLPIRFLSAIHLYVLAPAGASIPYDASMERADREAAIRAWVRLIPPGQLPPPPKKK